VAVAFPAKRRQTLHMHPTIKFSF